MFLSETHYWNDWSKRARASDGGIGYHRETILIYLESGGGKNILSSYC